MQGIEQGKLPWSYIKCKTLRMGYPIVAKMPPGSCVSVRKSAQTPEHIRVSNLMKRFQESNHFHRRQRLDVTQILRSVFFSLFLLHLGRVLFLLLFPSLSLIYGSSCTAYTDRCKSLSILITIVMICVFVVFKT